MRRLHRCLFVGVRYSATPIWCHRGCIMGSESDHRTFAPRFLDIAPQDGGPLGRLPDCIGGAPVFFFQGERASDKTGYERPLVPAQHQPAVPRCFFCFQGACSISGFDTTKPHTFAPFTPPLATPLGEFISFTGAKRFKHNLRGSRSRPPFLRKTCPRNSSPASFNASRIRHPEERRNDYEVGQFS